MPVQSIHDRFSEVEIILSGTYPIVHKPTSTSCNLRFVLPGRLFNTPVDRNTDNNLLTRTRRSAMADPASAPTDDNNHDTSASEDNATPQATGRQKQPWRALYPCLQDVLAGVDSALLNRPTENIAASWHDLERGLLPEGQTESLARLMGEKYEGKPWYKLAKKKGRCSSCGNDPCTCAVFEGG